MRSTKSVKAASGSAAVNAEFELEGEDLEQSGRTLTRVLLFVFLGIALLMLSIAVMTGISTGQKLAREQPVIAQVTGMTERKDSDGNSSFYPVVAFDVPDGGRYNAQLSEGFWPQQQRVGDLVTVLYDTSNPMNARLQSNGGTAVLWTWTIITGILGVAFLLAAALAWGLGRQSD